MPAGRSRYDGIGVRLPAERFRIDIMFGQVSVDGGLEVDDAEECAASEPALGEGGEEAFYRVQPGGAGRGKVEGHARVTGEPGDHLRVLVGSVVVEDDMHGLSGRDGLFDGVEEADELLMPMALHAPSDDLAIQ